MFNRKSAPPVKMPGSVPNNKTRIFFLELSMNWHPYTLCSVYSTAKMNSQAEVTVFSKNMKLPSLWNGVKNVHLKPLDIEKILSIEEHLLAWYNK